MIFFIFIVGSVSAHSSSHSFTSIQPVGNSQSFFDEYLMKQVATPSKLKCLSLCSIDEECSSAFYDAETTQCFLFENSDFKPAESALNSFYIKKFVGIGEKCDSMVSCETNADLVCSQDQTCQCLPSSEWDDEMKRCSFAELGTQCDSKHPCEPGLVCESDKCVCENKSMSRLVSYFEGKYFESTQKATWDNANNFCQCAGKQLLMLDTRTKLDEIINSNFAAKRDYWVGFNYVQGSWTWQDGSILNSNSTLWASHHDLKNKCGLYHSGKGLCNHQCSEMRMFICQ